MDRGRSSVSWRGITLGKINIDYFHVSGHLELFEGPFFVVQKYFFGGMS